MRAVTAVFGLAVVLASCAAHGGTQVAPDPRVGAVFRDGGNRHVCTGAVLHSAGGDLVLTAAHCLLGPAKTTFVPGFAGGAGPADIWTVDAVYFDRRWMSSRDPRADYAIARVSGSRGTVEGRVGSALALGAAPPSGTRLSVTGYPAGVGGGPVGCQGNSSVTDSGFPSLPCAGLVGGTSGAPWVDGTRVVGLVGGFEGGGCTENLSYSPPFDEHTAQLLARAEARGPGDVAPTDYDDNC